MKNLEFNQMENLEGGLSWGCWVAIGGTLATTAGAAFITGGASLIIFLVAKGLATASIIDACS